MSDRQSLGPADSGEHSHRLPFNYKIIRYNSLPLASRGSVYDFEWITFNGSFYDFEWITFNGSFYDFEWITFNGNDDGGLSGYSSTDHQLHYSQ